MSNENNHSRCVLYTTLGCHLCEQAEQLIQQTTGSSVQTIEIFENPMLMERYAVRIPVLKRLDNGQELSWPFDSHAINTLLSG